MINWICEKCGTQFDASAAPPAHCPICEDEAVRRSRVGHATRREHRALVRRRAGDPAGVNLLRLGGHFRGGTVLHWTDAADGAGALFVGDIIAVGQDRRSVSFMYSFPNLIPLSAAAVRRIASAVEPYSFERLYGGWWGLNIMENGKEAVRRFAERYQRAIDEGLSAQE